MRRSVLLLVLCAELQAHKFHYSKTEMNWNSGSRSLEIIATLHTDDIEAYLRKAHPQLEIDRDAPAEGFVCAYVQRALQMPAIRPRCLGMKVSLHFVDVFLEASAPAPPKSMENRILVEDLDDQRNDVELKKDGKLLGPRIQFNSSETRKDLRW